MPNLSYAKAGPCLVIDAATGEILRQDAPLTETAVKRIVDGDRPHANSIASRIKTDTELRAKFDRNAQAYYENYEAYEAQITRGVNATSLTISASVGEV